MSTAAAAQGTAAAEVAAAAVAVPVPVAAPAAAPAGAAVVPEPSDAPGISQEQLRVWWEKFEAKVVTLADDARSLMSEDKADLIVDLLRNWDSLTPAQRKAKTPNYIYFKNRYMLSGESDLIKADGSGVQRRVVRIDKLFDELLPYHLQHNHAKGLGLYKRIATVMAHVTKQVCIAFCEDCPICLKQQEVKKPRAGYMPIITHGMNMRGQVDLIDLQSMADGEYKYILNYQDHGIKDAYAEPLKTKTVLEITFALIRIWKIIGPPKILHSDNGREFSNLANMKGVALTEAELELVIEEIRWLWPGTMTVKGRPRHSQSQGGIEKANRLLQKRLKAWMDTNNCTAWSTGLFIVTWGINTDFHSGIKCSPYELRFGQKPECGISDLPLSRALLMKLTTEQQLWDVLPPAYRALVDESAELMHSGDTVPAGTDIQYCAAASLCLSLPLSAATAF